MDCFTNFKICIYVGPELAIVDAVKRSKDSDETSEAHPLYLMGPFQ